MLTVTVIRKYQNSETCDRSNHDIFALFQPQRDAQVWVLFLGSWKLLTQYLQDAGTEQSQFSICQFAQTQAASIFS